MLQNILIRLTIIFIIIFTFTACYEAKMKQEGQQAVNAFLEEMSPELARKIDEIEAEITLTEEKINKLSELKLKHPNYAGKIESSRRQWEVLQNKLQQSLKEIEDVMESTYVTYELDRIQGGNQFNKISGKLLSSADLVLASAGTTKEAIEEALNEVDNQSVPSLNINSTTDKTIPIIENSVKDINYSNPINTNIACDAKKFLTDVHLNLMMMIIATDKVEQNILRKEIDKSNIKFERAIATMSKTGNEQITILQDTWMVFKNTNKIEIFPQIQAGANDKALNIANNIQAERMDTMNTIIQNLIENDCD
ncbi:MAG TPA: hypothetical protein ENK59_05885 [Thioploca sp.]|nr:hypothetical protein [Thioploca sp.]